MNKKDIFELFLILFLQWKPMGLMLRATAGGIRNGVTVDPVNDKRQHLLQPTFTSSKSVSASELTDLAVKEDFKPALHHLHLTEHLSITNHSSGATSY